MLKSRSFKRDRVFSWPYSDPPCSSLMAATPFILKSQAEEKLGGDTKLVRFSKEFPAVFILIAAGHADALAHAISTLGRL